MHPIRKVCVFGVGGVGGVIGAKIAQTVTEENSGREIYFVARGEHLREIQANGLLVTGNKPIICRPTRAVSDFRELPLADLIFVTVKGYDLENTIRQIASHIKDDAIVIPLLNGVDNHQRIRNHLKTGIVLPACVYVSAFIEKPGTVRHVGNLITVVFGNDPDHPDTDCQSVSDLLDEAEITYRQVENPFAAIWEKYALIAASALITAAYGRTYGEIVSQSELCGQLKMVIREIQALAAAEGVALPQNTEERVVQLIAKMPAETKTSYQRDVERGRKNEGDQFGGTLIRLSQKHGIPVPVTGELYRRIEESIHGKKKV